MDVLGFTQMLLRAERSHTQAEFLKRLHETLSKGREGLEEREIPELKEAFDRAFSKDRYALKAFTDNIVIGWPIHSDAESETADAFTKLAMFQFNMVLSGFFVRGAISIGDAFVDDIVVSGNALIEAYNGECNLARDPRIILTKSAVTVVSSHLDHYAYREKAPQTRDLLKDSDGQWFLNYLDVVVLMAEEEQGPFYEEFEKHKAAVESKLAEHKSNPPIFAKYAWVAGYHNSFCDLHSQHFSEQHKINTDLFRAKPKLITE